MLRECYSSNSSRSPSNAANLLFVSAKSFIKLKLYLLILSSSCDSVCSLSLMFLPVTVISYSFKKALINYRSLVGNFFPMMYACIKVSFFRFSSITILIFCSRDWTFFCSTPMLFFSCWISISNPTWIFFLSEMNLSLAISAVDFSVSSSALRFERESLSRYTS